MEQRPQYVKEVEELLAHLNNEDNQDKQRLATDKPDQVIDMYIEDFAEEERITLIRKKPSSLPVIREEEERDLPDLDTVPLAPKPAPEAVSNAFIGVLLLSMLVPLFCIAVQLYFLVNPYTTTITLYTRSQQEVVTGTVQLGRVINPLTLSQSQIVPTTGHGHQDARAATGTITFYNGQFQAITIPAGTTLTGSNGIQVITDGDAVIPAASPNPPSFGQVSFAAHVTSTGERGNIAAYDINQTCCATSILVKNTAAFHGGADERDFQTVAPSDIASAAAPLRTTLSQSMQDTLTGQLKAGEALTAQHCTQTQTSDHQPGQEATQVKVTASETCSGIAYNTQELTNNVTRLLTSQAIANLGSGYSMLDTPQVAITGAAAQNTKVLLSFKAQSTWIYALTTKVQRALKKLIAGKNAEKALQLLHSLPGIERVAIESSGFGDSSRIPKALSSIHLAIFYGL